MIELNRGSLSPVAPSDCLDQRQSISRWVRIYYNSELLSGLITRFEKFNKPIVVEMLSNLSSVVWAHILIYGQYTFGDRSTMIDIEGLLKDI